MGGRGWGCGAERASQPAACGKTRQLSRHHLKKLNIRGKLVCNEVGGGKR